MALDLPAMIAGSVRAGEGKPLHERVLNLWGEGTTGPEISRRLAVPIGTISTIVGKARAAKDPRAVDRRIGKYC